MKLAFAIATIAALQQPAVTHADCNFGSNYTAYLNSSDLCSFDVGFGAIIDFSESNTTSSGDTNVTTNTYRGKVAIWKMDDKNSTVQCYPDVSSEVVLTSYPNGSTFIVETGDVPFVVEPTYTVVDAVPLSSPGMYYFQGGLMEGWADSDGNTNITKAEGEITDLCEVLGSGGGAAAPAPTPTPPATEAPSSGQVAAATIIPCVAAAILNSLMFM
jgi:hypothetical protein